jgi:cobalt/nickel transport system permease protein
VLSPPLLAAGVALAAGGVAVGLRKMDYSRIPQVAVMSSAFFMASLIRIPFGPANLHLTLNGLMGIILGWMAFPSILVALGLQALLFQFGGLTTLGVNTCIMAVPAVAAHRLFGPLARRERHGLSLVSGFGAGSGAVMLGTALLAIALYKTREGFLPLIKMLFLAQIPAMAVEGAVTAFIVAFLYRVKPEILAENG